MTDSPKTRVLISAPYMIPAIDRFRPSLSAAGVEIVVAEVDERLDADQLLAYAGEVDGVICGDDRFTQKVLKAFAPRLKVISKWGTGIDSIDQAGAQGLGIAVMNTPDAFTEAVSDTVLGYMLAFARRIPWMDLAMKAGKWEKHPGVSLHERTLGVVGVGRIGKAVLRKAQAFGMTLLGNDIEPVNPGFLEQVSVQLSDLDDLLGKADFISLNCDLNPTSRHLIHSENLRVVKQGAVLINTSRGPVIDQPALVEALQTGPLAGAALDVFEDEPLPTDSPLRRMDNVLLAPHNANASPEAWERVHRNTISNLLRALGLDPASTGLVE
ncbi:MAG: phosphoglycerate dehydrogenase [Anaerolineales bacterium]